MQGGNAGVERLSHSNMVISLAREKTFEVDVDLVFLGSVSQGYRTALLEDFGDRPEK